MVYDHIKQDLILPHRIGDLENLISDTQGYQALPHRIGDLEIDKFSANRPVQLPHRIGDLETHALRCGGFR